MRTIHFKNGTTKEINDDIFKEIVETLTSGFNFYYKISQSLVINIHDISFID